jgi:hypothetical protein
MNVVKRAIATLLCWAGCLGPLSAQEPPARLTSLISVIASPNSYDGRRIRLIGYLANNGLDKTFGIYVTEIDGRNFLIANSVSLHVNSDNVEKMVGKYVIVEGVFRARKGRVADYLSGYLDVSSIKLWMQGDVSK